MIWQAISKSPRSNVASGCAISQTPDTLAALMRQPSGSCHHMVLVLHHFLRSRHLDKGIVVDLISIEDFLDPFLLP